MVVAGERLEVLIPCDGIDFAFALELVERICTDGFQLGEETLVLLVVVGYNSRCELSAAVVVGATLVLQAFERVCPLILAAAEERNVHFPVGEVSVGVVAV